MAQLIIGIILNILIHVFVEDRESLSEGGIAIGELGVLLPQVLLEQLGPQFTGTGDADRLQVAIQGVEVKPFERGSHGDLSTIAAVCSSRERSSLISRKQVPYMLGAVDRGHIQVALA